MRILITRPRIDAQELAQMLRKRQHEPLISPVIEIKSTDAPLPDPGIFHGMVITSKNTLRCLAQMHDLSPFHNLPLFAVGQATANQAREMGFSEVIEGTGGALELAPIIDRKLEGTNHPHVFHPGGKQKAVDLTALLAKTGIQLSEIQAYEAVPAKDLTNEAISLLSSRKLDAVILLSPRTARHFYSLIRKNRLEKAMKSVSCLCLSQNVASALDKMACKERLIPPAPDLLGIISLI